MKQFLMLLAAVILIAAAPAQAGEWGFAPTVDTNGDFGVKAEYRWGGSSERIQLAAADTNRRATARDGSWVQSRDVIATGPTDGVSTFRMVEACEAAGRSGFAVGYVPSKEARERRAKNPPAAETEVRDSSADMCFYMKVDKGWVWAFEPKGTLFWYHRGESIPFALDACGNSVSVTSLIIRKSEQGYGGRGDSRPTPQLVKDDEKWWCARGFWYGAACVVGTGLVVGGIAHAMNDHDDHQTTIIVNNNNGGGGVGGTINGSVGGTQNQVPGNGIGGSVGGTLNGSITFGGADGTISVGGSLSGSVDGSIGSQSGSVFGTIN